MLGVNSSLWIRIEFQLEEGQAATFDTLTLRMKYEDGFVAYINGQEVVSRNAPNSIYWDSAALSDRPDANTSVTEVINLTAFLSTLQTGMNVLSIHGLNDDKNNGDFLILPELVAARNEEVPQYFTTATPGTFNVSGGIGVVDANDKITHRRILLILKSLRPMPCDSNRCISASQTAPSGSRTVAVPFIFRQCPLP